MNKDLTFRDRNYEEGYLLSKQKFQAVVVNIISANGVFIRLILMILTNQRMVENKIAFTVVILYVIIQITAVLIVRYKIHLVERVLTILIGINFMASFESYLISKQAWNNILYLHFGSHVGNILVCLLVGRVRWKNTSLMMVILTIIYNLRYLDMEINRAMNYFPLAITVFYCLSMIPSSYFLEKHDRYRYREKKDYDLSMESFKYFIKEILPSGVMILRNKGVLFTNSALQNMLQKHSKYFSLEDTKSIHIDKKGLTINTIKQGPSKKFRSDEIKNSLYSHDRTLFDIINEEELGENASCNYLEYQGWLSLESSIENMERAYFDIKIGSILWEGKPAVMILLAENPMILKIKHLDSQAIYKDRLLATVSHDLRTPLNGIIGMIEMSMQCEISLELRKSLQVALRSSKLLLFFVNDILDYSQIIHGTLRLSFSTFSLGPVLEDLSKLIKFQAKNKGLQFIFEDKTVNSASDGMIRSDPNRLKQIVLNLLGNSLKFTSEGFIRLSLSSFPEVKANKSTTFFTYTKNDRLRICEPQNRKYLIEVEDSGCGIKKENIPKLFKLFGKFDDGNSARLNDTGVGLGLSISQSLVKFLNSHEHGMDIKVKSELGKGSCFYFPILSIENEEKIESQLIEEDKLNEEISELYSIPEEKENFLKPTLSKPHFHWTKLPKDQKRNSKDQLEIAQGIIEFENLKVLVVDDDQINIMVCSSYLKSLGISNFKTAFNGLQAVETVENWAKDGRHFDIILMDCNMPLMDGYEATRNLCQKMKQGVIPQVPIIACTANASPKDYEECFQAGMIDYLSKPFTLNQLKAVIIKVLGKN